MQAIMNKFVVIMNGRNKIDFKNYSEDSIRSYSDSKISGYSLKNRSFLLQGNDTYSTNKMH
jgi:hypothetical protein